MVGVLNTCNVLTSMPVFPFGTEFLNVAGPVCRVCGLTKLGLVHPAYNLHIVSETFSYPPLVTKLLYSGNLNCWY